MAACNPQTLLDDAACFECLPAGMRSLLDTALLCRIAQGLGMTCDVQTLLTDAACFSCLTPGERVLVQLQLLCNIAGGTGGGGIGAGCVLSTNGNPEGVLVSSCSPAFAIDPNSGALYIFTGTAGTNTGWTFKA